MESKFKVEFAKNYQAEQKASVELAAQKVGTRCIECGKVIDSLVPYGVASEGCCSTRCQASAFDRF